LIALRSQRVVLCWTFIAAAIYGFVFLFLLHMFPPPSAQWTPAQIAHFYTEHSTDIRVGAVLMSWTSAFAVPFAVVLATQMFRHEDKRAPVWSILGGAGGILMSIFLVLPPIFWGTAAFSPGRPAEITAALHELGLLIFVTTDQYFIFLWVALAVICLLPNPPANSPFPRWFGYFTAWTALGIEVGAVAYMTRSGPFAWNGLLAFWLPTFVFFAWMLVVALLLFTALSAQIRQEDSETLAAVSTV
jgi:hypothetical protein